MNLESVIAEHRQMVQKIARAWMRKVPPNIEFDDLEQIGLIALCDAVTRYEDGHNATFKTFASYRVNGAIMDHLRATDHLSRDDRRIRKAINSARATLGELATDTAVAEMLGVTVEELRQMDLRSSAQIVSTEMHTSEGEDTDLLNLHEEAATADISEEIEARDAIAFALNSLTDRERFVIVELFDKDREMQEIAKDLDISPSMVTWIKRKALERMRRVLQ